MEETFASHVLANAVREFHGLQTLADKAIAQVDDTAFFARLDSESNSIAIVAKHLAGNMRSRWTDFLTTDGEKPDRNRDGEFVIGPEDGRPVLEGRLQEGWKTLYEALAGLHPADLEVRVLIRGEQHTVVQAVHRQMTHYGYHVGQIVMLAKHAQQGEWRTLSIPRGGSVAFDARLREWYGGGAPKSEDRR